MLELLITIGAILGGCYARRDIILPKIRQLVPMIIDLWANIFVFFLNFPLRCKRQAARRLTHKTENKILGAMILDGESVVNVTGECVAFYATHEYPSAAELRHWLGCLSTGNLLLFYYRNDNIIASIIDIEDGKILIPAENGGEFSDLVFDSIDVDDLSGFSIYNLRQQTIRKARNTENLASENDAQEDSE